MLTALKKSQIWVAAAKICDFWGNCERMLTALKKSQIWGAWVFGANTGLYVRVERAGWALPTEDGLVGIGFKVGRGGYRGQ